MENIKPGRIHYHALHRILYETTLDGIGEIGITKKITDEKGNPREFHFKPHERFRLQPCHAKTMEDLKAKIAAQIQLPVSSILPAE